MNWETVGVIALVVGIIVALLVVGALPRKTKGE